MEKKVNDKEIALGNIILRGVVGSTAHGTGMHGQEDRDEMGIFVEPPVAVCGLHPVDHYIKRDKPEGVRSEPGDLDLTLYSLRKFCSLAAGGNPSVLLLLWLKEYMIVEPLGAELIGLRESFLSKRCGEAFLGYLVQQRMRLTGERTRNVSRPELVERYGYDTKFAMHALRLGIQGIEVMEKRQMTIPVPEPERMTLRAVRGGGVSLEEALKLISDAESRLRALVEQCEWEADLKKINEFLTSAHQEHWLAAA
jgi:uncharacterized protein